MSLEEALDVWKKAEGLQSIYGSSVLVDQFNVEQGVYEEPLNTDKYLDPSYTFLTQNQSSRFARLIQRFVVEV